MRRAVIPLLLCFAGPATAAPPAVPPVAPTAVPRAAPGYRIEVLVHDLAAPSGAATDGKDLILTDLGSGTVVRRAPDGSTSVLFDGLPVGRDVMGEPTGPYKVQVLDGRIFVAQGWQDVARDELPVDHAILELVPGAPPRVVNNALWNPYDFAWGGSAWYVADAGRNALMRLEPSGALGEVFAFPDLQHRRDALQALSPTEFRGEETYEVDAVPTGVAVAGARVYVALFGGFPFLDGGGLVVSLPKAGGAARARIEVKNLDAPIDVAFDPAGRLLVLEFGRFDLEKGFLPETGRLSRIDLRDGTRELLADRLSTPVTLVPEREGAILVEMGGAILRVAPAR